MSGRKLGEKREVHLMFRAYECTWYCQIWLQSSVIITLPNQVTFCAMKKERQSVQLSPFPTHWLFEFSGTLEPILPFWKLQQMTSWRDKQRPEFTKYSTLLLPCKMESWKNMSGLLHPEVDAYASSWAHILVVCIPSPPGGADYSCISGIYFSFFL